MSKIILITGGCGFVGSNIAVLLKQKYPGYNIIALDNLKRRGSELNLPRLRNHEVKFIHGDIRNKEDFDDLGHIDLLIEASAEPSVMSGINSSLDYLINTNLTGTINCLNFANRHKAGFIFLSTNRIYPIRQIENIAYRELETRFEMLPGQQLRGVSDRGISEKFPLEGARSFYGATKLASELLIQEYSELLGMHTIINRCGVLTGPYQMGKIDQGVVVLWVARHFWKKNLSYIGYGGEGKQVRDILHIDDLFTLVDQQIHNMKQYSGQTFNVGGGISSSVSLQELTALCEEVTGNSITIEKDKEQRVADIRIYISDNSKVSGLSKWTPKKKPIEIVSDIFHWIESNHKDLKDILN